MRKLSISLLAAAFVLSLVTIAWPYAVVPRLVKFPLNLNQHLTYTGTLVTYVDPSTGLTLAKPTSVPVTVSRHTYTSGGTSGTALVHDDVTVVTPDASHSQVSVYAVDRRAMVNLTATGTTALVADNPVDRTGTYFVTLPMGLGTDQTLPMWKEETAKPYLLHLTGTATVDGVNVVTGKATVPMTPTTGYENKLLASWGLPSALTPAQASARLQAAAGVQVSVVSAALAPRLSPSELATLSAALTAPVDLVPYAYGSGEMAAEPKTGTIVDASNVVDGRAVLPVSPQLASALAILRSHTDVAGVSQLVTALQSMTSTPQPVMELRYTQSPASVSAMASYARSSVARMNLATRYLPGGTLLLSVLLLVAGLLAGRRRPPAPEQVAAQPVEEVHRLAA